MSKPATVSRARMYEVIRAPLITEKTTNGSEHGQVTFKVSADATKPEIKQAIDVIVMTMDDLVNELEPPINPKARVLWLKNDPTYRPALDCAPCFERTCPLGHLRCLNDLIPDRVAQELASLEAQASSAHA